jgi:heme oxygenase
MLFERLRLETRALHESIERHLPVLHTEFTSKQYRQLLVRYLGFYTPVEERLTALRGDGLTVFDEGRRKRPLLLRDLHMLGETDDVPECGAIPQLVNVSQGVGCLYVLEGSTLGGQIISRHLHAKLGITAESGGAFFASYGAELGKRWKDFRERLGADERMQRDADEIVAAARDTFSCFEAWLAGMDSAA